MLNEIIANNIALQNTKIILMNASTVSFFPFLHWNKIFQAGTVNSEQLESYVCIFNFQYRVSNIIKPEDQWSCETLTWYLGQAQNKIWFKMAQSFLRKASFNFQM